MTYEQIVQHSQHMTNDRALQGEIRFLCLQVQADEQERYDALAVDLQPSLFERFVGWFLKGRTA